MDRRRGFWWMFCCVLGVAAACGDSDAPDTDLPGTGPGVSLCGANGVLLCDDFEQTTVGGAPDPATWQVEVFNKLGSISIDGTQAHSGSRSVHVVGTGQESYRSVLFTTTKPFPPQHNSFYARVFMRSKNAMGEGHSTYFGAGSGDSKRMVRIGFHQHVFETNLIHPDKEYELLSGPWGQPDQGVQLQAAEWHCVEAFFNGAEHELRVWFDGNEISGLHATDWKANLSTWSPQYAKAWFGFETYHGEQDELWYDDIIIGTQRIGCVG
jgi:hypothetical protein